MATTREPFRVVEHQDGQCSLVFSDFGCAAASVVEANGGHGGGYSWEAMVKAILEVRRQECSVSFDCESDMFAAVSREMAALKSVAAILRELMRDRQLAQAAITHAKTCGYFE